MMGEIKMALEGKVWRYGDNIDTDVIIPARYLNSFDPQELASHCMVDIDESFAQNVQEGDIMVSGKNFGCGSSREHAPVAIKASGVPVVIAASFARIFYRNGINIGLPLLEIGDDVEKISAGDRLRVDKVTGKIENLTTGDVFNAHPLPGFVENIAKAGGLINYIKEKKINA
ncbi:3-isopropylmalate/(R)-2-methylmalate dehydratase small subunit [Pectinatus brassicae]|uniref:3-isopropylmalate dehydratase small subunit n=2 Tax=Pectinatus brassicae TaxID=862415 RepID=A0A840UQB3_9FIRM|nr:3-isopropylmalate/(R)-2-methylmalate dehydratase small subunit [Pectinatus brassicae]